MFKRILSLALAMALVFVFVPTPAYAQTPGYTVVIPTQYDWASDFSDGTAVVMIGSDILGINSTGGRIPVPEANPMFSEGLGARFMDGRWGFVDEADRVVIPPMFDFAMSFSNGLAAVEISGMWGFIDRSGQIVIPMRYNAAESFSDGLAAVLVGEFETGFWGFIDSSGREVLPAKFSMAGSFVNGLAPVAIDEDDIRDWPSSLKWGFIDKNGREAIPFVYDWAESFSEGLALVQTSSGYSFINSSGVVTASPPFDRVRSITGGLAAVAIGEFNWAAYDFVGKWGYISVAGSTGPAPPSQRTIRVMLDGRPLTFDVPPQLMNGRTLVPLRAIFEALGATVDWSEATQTVTATKGTTTVVLTIGSTSPTVNGTAVTIDQPGVLVNGRTLVPLRFVGESLGVKVDWDPNTWVVTITSP